MFVWKNRNQNLYRDILKTESGTEF